MAQFDFHQYNSEFVEVDGDRASMCGFDLDSGYLVSWGAHGLWQKLGIAQVLSDHWVIKTLLLIIGFYCSSGYS